MAAVDTNVLVRLIMKDDARQHARALGFVRGHAPVFVSDLCWIELAWVLVKVYQRPKPIVLKALRALLDTGDVLVNDPGLLESALGLWAQSRTEFADCMILATVQARGQAPLGTFDKRLARLPGALAL